MLCAGVAVGWFVGAIVMSIIDPSPDSGVIGTIFLTILTLFVAAWFVPGWWSVLRSEPGLLSRTTAVMCVAGLTAWGGTFALDQTDRGDLAFIFFPATGAIGSLTCRRLTTTHASLSEAAQVR